MVVEVEVGVWKWVCGSGCVEVWLVVGCESWGWRQEVGKMGAEVSHANVTVGGEGYSQGDFKS